MRGGIMYELPAVDARLEQIGVELGIPSSVELRRSGSGALQLRVDAGDSRHLGRGQRALLVSVHLLVGPSP